MRVSLFITCLVDALYPEVGVSMVRLLQRLGLEVDFPEQQTCCGQPAFNSGYPHEAKQAAKTLLEAFELSDYVVSPSGSCTGMVHHFYEQLFEGERELQVKARRLKEKTYEFSQFVVGVLGKEDLAAFYPETVTYHPSCHASRLLGVKEAPLKLLHNVRGLQLVPLSYEQDCCGFGGTFAVKMANISTAMVEEKAGHVVKTGASTLVGTDMGCLMNIQGRLEQKGASVTVLHLAQLLERGIAQGGGTTGHSICEGQ